MKELSPLAKRVLSKPVGTKIAKPIPKVEPSENQEVVVDEPAVEEVVEAAVEELPAVATKPKKLIAGINIAKMKEAAIASKDTDEPEALCLLNVGTRQSGKSTVLGTASGTMILLATSDEAHSIETAKAKAQTAYGLTIIPVIIDMLTDDVQGNALPPSEWSALTADQAFVKLINYLDALEATPNLSEMVQWVALESLYSIFKRINEKKNIQQIKTVQKNNFRAQEVALKELLDINQKLLLLQKRGVNVVVNCPAAAEQDKNTGLYDQIEPLLEGYRNNLHVVGIFPDICTVGKAIVETDEGEVYSGYFFQFGGSASKAGKKVSGEERCINFKPRINGILDEETPAFMNADLTELAQYKKAVRASRQLKGE